MKLKIGSYARLSYDRNGEELGVARQHDDNARIADLRGWVIQNTYTDNDLSAYQKKVVRPSFERMLQDLEAGVIDGIVAYDLDRLWRQPRDLERVIDLYDDKPRPFATAQGDYDLSNSDGRTMARIMAAMANKSSADTSRRIKRKILEQAQNGKPRWSKRPYGWNSDGSLHETESVIVRRMIDRFLGGGSYRSIVADLDANDCRTCAGKPWGNSAVKRLMVNPRLAAIRVHDGVEYPGNWEPLVTPEEWEALKSESKARSIRMVGKPTNRRYLLTGLLICSRCRHSLNGMTKRDEGGAGGKLALRRTYQCASPNHYIRRRLDACAGMCIGAQPLEHVVREAVLFRLESEELEELMIRGEKNTVTMDAFAEQKRLFRRRDALVDDYADGTLSKDDFRRAVARVDARLNEIDKQLEATRINRFDPQLKVGEALRDAWASRSDEWKRDLLDVLIDEIVIHPCTTRPVYEADGKKFRFSPERVEIKWKV